MNKCRIIDDGRADENIENKIQEVWLDVEHVLD